LITELHFTVNLHRPDLQFGWDNYNQVVVDNLKLRQDHCDCPPPVLPTVARAIADWNMDDKPLDGYSCYDWASDERRVRVNCGTNTSVAGGVGGSVGWWLSMDNSPLAPPNTPLWAGCATYGSGPVNWRLFDTNSLAAYRISFDARVEGLASNTLATNCELHLLLNSPRGNLRLAFPVPATTNWAQTAWVLQSGTASSGSKSSFATNYNTYTELVMGLQIDQAVSSEWGYDGDNLLVVDNLKLERLYIACPPLTLTLTNNFAVVSWPPASSGTTELQTAINPAGPFAGIPGATNPCIVPLNGQPKYFRTRWLPPSGGNF
jgi:hypothetical protein